MAGKMVAFRAVLLRDVGKMVRFTQLRWSNIFVQNSSRLLSAIMEYLGLEQDFFTVLNVYSSEALDPHVNRERFREGLWS